VEVERVRDIGEQGVLRRVQRFCPGEIVGDDAAKLVVPPDRHLVVTTDMLVDEIHFSDRTTAPADVGWRAAAANLSDLAAMGANPTAITVGLGLPGETAVAWVEQVYEGMTACLDRYQTPIVGGDICRSPVRTLSITALGSVRPDRVIRRNAAQPGDAIVVTGVHGASRAGLELLLNPPLGAMLATGDRDRLIQAHQRPQPRLDALPMLQQSWETAGRMAGMDSSDGLADAVVQICRASGVGARLDRARIAILPAIAQITTPTQALEWALYGGEDFELVLCLPQVAAEQLVDWLGGKAAIVGSIIAGTDAILVDEVGPIPDRLLVLDRGFQHFSAEPSARPA
jgi:thiamine-monophosphate kinase